MPIHIHIVYMNVNRIMSHSNGQKKKTNDWYENF